MSTAITFTVEERSALLRAARAQIDIATDEIIRLHELDGRAGSENRAAADAAAAELKHLASAVNKLWISSGGGALAAPDG